MKLLHSLLPLALVLTASARGAEVDEHHDWSLICAVLSRDAVAVKELLARGADPNAVIDANETVLAAAVRKKGVFARP